MSQGQELSGVRVVLFVQVSKGPEFGWLRRVGLIGVVSRRLAPKAQGVGASRSVTRAALSGALVDEVLGAHLGAHGERLLSYANVCALRHAALPMAVHHRVDRVDLVLR